MSLDVLASIHKEAIHMFHNKENIMTTNYTNRTPNSQI